MSATPATGTPDRRFPPYKCPTCHRVSWHPEDAKHRFCSLCGFEADRDLQARVEEALRRRAQAAYRDESMPFRHCSACGAPYRGPAIYCSLTCAEGDAGGDAGGGPAVSRR